ncbi:MAG: hypothetical protein NTW11_01470 [Candidatus Staskawiczbacteria bacterium]|nr:hypothetical protein [Candidatus Staskawiczbacteria bacterium]
MVEIKSKELILKWQKLIKERYNWPNISLEEAKQFGEDLCNYFEVLLEPDGEIT